MIQIFSLYPCCLPGQFGGSTSYDCCQTDTSWQYFFKLMIMSGNQTNEIITFWNFTEVHVSPELCFGLTSFNMHHLEKAKACFVMKCDHKSASPVKQRIVWCPSICYHWPSAMRNIQTYKHETPSTKFFIISFLCPIICQSKIYEKKNKKTLFFVALLISFVPSISISPSSQLFPTRPPFSNVFDFPFENYFWHPSPVFQCLKTKVLSPVYCLPP